VAVLEAPTKVRRGRVEDHCCIDVSVLRKTGKLEPGACCLWSWARGNSIVGAVDVVAKADAIEVCGYIASGADVEPVQDVLQRSRPGSPTGRVAEAEMQYRLS
jgi:hypothetical protein